MMRLKFLVVVFAVLAGILALSGPGAKAANDLFNQSCQGTAASGPVCKQAKGQTTKTTNPLVDVIHTAANIVALITSIGAVIIIIYSGFMFVTAGGAIGGQRAGDNPTRARQARSTLMGAVIGLVIVALAWSITTVLTNWLL